MPVKDKKFFIPTPIGAFYLVQNNRKCWQKKMLQKAFLSPKSLSFEKESLRSLFSTGDENLSKHRFDECQRLQLIQILDKEMLAPAGHIEEQLDKIIHVFSNKEKALLSDSQGFCIANHGFPADISEEISVLSADIAIMHKRRALGINHNLGFNSQAWAIVDAAGKSCLGFWPLNIGQEILILAVEGKPFFNQPAMVSLIWTLYLRFGNTQ